WRRVSHEHIVGDIRLKIPHRLADYVRLLQEVFPQDREGIGGFFEELEAIYHELYSPDTRKRDAIWRWANTPYLEMVDRFVRDPQLRHFMAALSAYITDAPKTISAITYAPCLPGVDDTFYPAGGSQVLADALVGAIEAHGGKVRLSTAVSRIFVENNQAKAIQLSDGTVIPADVVVSNTDVRQTFCRLLASEAVPAHWAKRTAHLRPSCSVFIVFLGLDYVPDAAAFIVLPEHSVGVAVPSVVDSSLASPGHTSVTLMRVMPHSEAVTWKRSTPDYEARKRREGDALIALCERALPGLREHIVYRQEATPATVERYVWSTDGAIYHLPLDEWHPPNVTPIRGLYLAGTATSTRPGVEDAARSGMLCAEAILAKGS
ncbi:MAG: NAD(P)/FAD-dependent oxidoreductase, partial [Verrucomicrobia bacterium]|nr:NAD(P)/FAD-dependent oxidoreductase [Verrucomicrobiota bacterium]